MVTIKEIAARSGFSTATVSRLLNDDPTFSVSAQTKSKIFEVAKALGYQHEKHVRSLNYKLPFSIQFLLKKNYPIFFITIFETVSFSLPPRERWH